MTTLQMRKLRLGGRGHPPGHRAGQESRKSQSKPAAAPELSGVKNGHPCWEPGALPTCEELLFTFLLPSQAWCRCDKGRKRTCASVMLHQCQCDSEGSLRCGKDLFPTGDFLKQYLGRVFAKCIFWSDNNLTLILLFSAGTKPGPRLYHPQVICAAWKELRVRYRKKVGVLLRLPAGQHTGPLLGLFFFRLSHHNYFGNILFPSWT